MTKNLFDYSLNFQKILRVAMTTRRGLAECTKIYDKVRGSRKIKMENELHVLSIKFSSYSGKKVRWIYTIYRCSQREYKMNFYFSSSQCKFISVNFLVLFLKKISLKKVLENFTDSGKIFVWDLNIKYSFSWITISGNICNINL